MRAYVELTHGMAIHAIAAGMNRHHKVDRDRHEGMARELQRLGHIQVAEAFRDLEERRIGAMYDMTPVWREF